MSGHDEVERALRADAASLTPPSVALDASAAARGARRRRLPVQAAVGTLSVLAVVGFGGLAVSALPQFGADLSSTDAGGESPAEAPEIGPLASPETTAPDSDRGGELDGDEGGASEEGAQGRDPDGETAWSVFACGDPLPPVGHGAQLGLALEVLPFEVSAVDGDRLPVTLTLTNTSSERITGTSAMWPHVALARQGTVVWHTAGAMELIGATIDLAPGESMRYETHLDLVVCEGPAGDNPFPDDLPAAPPGTYEVVAALDIAVHEPTEVSSGTELVISPRASLIVP